MASENGLSKRVQVNLLPSPLFEGISRAFSNVYEPLSNPGGIISLGIAENTPMYSDLASFLDENLKVTPNLLGYGAVNPGPPGLIPALVELYNSNPFNPVVPVEKEHIYLTAGCTALLDQLFWNFCDEGEGVLIGKPLYGGFANDLKARGKGKLLAVSLKGLDVFSKEAVGRYEEELVKAEKEGIKTRVLVLCTPHNPLGQYPPNPLFSEDINGRCYSQETMIEYMRLCQKYQIHLISDEIYALTTFPTDDIPEPTPFTSLLSIAKEGIIDPSLCHVVHGMSKVRPHK
jgi:1-aminocyclopropane-1-carboxylate synthase